MNLIIEKISEKHLPMVDAFSCVESKDSLSCYNSKERRRIIKHSKEMDDFLKNESLSDQEKGLSTTHLFIDDEEKKIIGYVSLCNDSIRLEFEERDQLNFTYTTVPAIKIARLAVSNMHQKMGIGTHIIMFSAYMGEKIRLISGVTFLTLDCYEHRLSFYKSIGFVENIIQPIVLPYDSPISMRLCLDEYLEKFN